jgi:hypothetical protein
MTRSLREFASSLPKEVKWHGNHHENTGSICLRAGDLTMLLENGNLRYINCGNNEIIRMIYQAVRDKDWITIKPVISDLSEVIEERSFRLSFTADYETSEIYFKANFVFEGRSDSSLMLKMEGRALRTFSKNRIGFCVLHPSDKYAGMPCTITHTDQTIEGTYFPDSISPRQPFKDIRSMAWQVAGARYKIDFQGDAFETEDQRNWTDASFKTYSTPLSLPYPVTIEEGTIISQRIDLLAEIANHRPIIENKKIKITIFPDEVRKFSSIGVGRSSRKGLLGKEETKILRGIKFDHYRVELYLFKSDWKIGAEQACIEAEELNLPLEFALFFDDNATRQAECFFEWCTKRMTDISVINIYHKSFPATPGKLANEVIPLIRRAIPSARTGTGTNANFAQLNSNRPVDQPADLICYSIHPQEHASDNLTLIENLTAQRDTVLAANTFAGGKRVWVSPVNIQRRFNANNSFFELAVKGDDQSSMVDSRLMSLLGACWTAGSLKYLMESGVEGVTYFETAGERGLVQGEQPSRWPLLFLAVEGMIFPVYHLFKYILSNKNMLAVKSISSLPLSADSIALTDGNQVKIVIVNFSGDNLQVIISGCRGMLRIRDLHEKNFEDAIVDWKWDGKKTERAVNSGKQLLLEPYSLTFAEGWLDH